MEVILDPGPSPDAGLLVIGLGLAKLIHLVDVFLVFDLVLNFKERGIAGQLLEELGDLFCLADQLVHVLLVPVVPLLDRSDDCRLQQGCVLLPAGRRLPDELVVRLEIDYGGVDVLDLLLDLGESRVREFALVGHVVLQLSALLTIVLDEELLEAEYLVRGNLGFKGDVDLLHGEDLGLVL